MSRAGRNARPAHAEGADLHKLQLHHVVSDVTAATGPRIVRAIIDGELDAKVLTAMRDSRCKATPEVIEGALHGDYQREHVFALKQALDLLNFYHREVEQFDRQIGGVLAGLAEQAPTPVKPLAGGRKRFQPVVLDAMPVNGVYKHWDTDPGVREERVQGR